MVSPSKMTLILMPGGISSYMKVSILSGVSAGGHHVPVTWSGGLVVVVASVTAASQRAPVGTAPARLPASTSTSQRETSRARFMASAAS